MSFKLKSSLIVIELIALLITALIVYFIFFREVLDKEQHVFEFEEPLEMNIVYDYLINNTSDLNASYAYVSESDHIKVVFNDINEDLLKNVFIVLDEENQQVHIKNINPRIDVDSYGFYSSIGLTVLNIQPKDLYLEIIENLKGFKDYVLLVEDGRESEFTINEDGSVNINLEDKEVVE